MEQQIWDKSWIQMMNHTHPQRFNIAYLLHFLFLLFPICFLLASLVLCVCWDEVYYYMWQMTVEPKAAGVAEYVE